MLEYTKVVLKKVSFDKGLFRKELYKAMKWLKKDERKALMLWCVTTFGHVYSDVISDVFEKIS